MTMVGGGGSGDWRGGGGGESKRDQTVKGNKMRPEGTRRYA